MMLDARRIGSALSLTCLVLTVPAAADTITQAHSWDAFALEFSTDDKGFEVYSSNLSTELMTFDTDRYGPLTGIEFSMSANFTFQGEVGSDGNLGSIGMGSGGTFFNDGESFEGMGNGNGAEGTYGDLITGSFEVSREFVIPADDYRIDFFTGPEGTTFDFLWDGTGGWDLVNIVDGTASAMMTGATVSIAYQYEGMSMVPGAGGIMMLGVLAGGRRRRRD